MYLVKPFVNIKHDYRIKITKEVSFKFAKKKVLKPYSRIQENPINSIRLTGYCFDDLEAEKQIKHFGNDSINSRNFHKPL